MGGKIGEPVRIGLCVHAAYGSVQHTGPHILILLSRWCSFIFLQISSLCGGYGRKIKFEVGRGRRRCKAFKNSPETYNNLPRSNQYPRRSCTLGRLPVLLVNVFGSMHGFWWWWYVDVVGTIMMMWRWWWWWWRGRLIIFWATGCWRVVSGEIYSTSVIIVVIVGIMSSFFFSFLILSAFSACCFPGRCVHIHCLRKCQWEAAWSRDVVCGRPGVIVGQFWLFYVDEGYSAPPVEKCDHCW